MKKSKRDVAKHLIQCLGIGIILSVIGWISTGLNAELLIAPFGASSAILFCLSESLVAKPRNVIGGYFISSAVGVTASNFLGNSTWSISLAVSVSILLMALTNTMHPPAGAIPIVAITSMSGWVFILFPVLSGAIILTLASVFHNKVFQRLLTLRPTEEEELREAPEDKTTKQAALIEPNDN